MRKILFVCMGNICRSPTAQGVFSALVSMRGLGAMFEVDSAGTHGHHTGARPDPRTHQIAAQRGYDLSPLRARQVIDADFERFDLIAAMDLDNLEWLTQRCPIAHQHKLKLMLEFAPEAETLEVPDPYYGGIQGFERVLDLIETASRGLLAHSLASQAQ